MLLALGGCSTEEEMRAEGRPSADAEPAAPSSATDPTAPEPTAPPADDLFTCDRTFTRASVPPADLVEQGGVSEWTGGYVGDGYRVRRAASSPLGLVALVSGDVATARRELTARGVALVGTWDDAESTRSPTPFAQVDALVKERLDPVLAEVRERVAGLDGAFEVREWVPNGEVVVAWADPVPAEVAALAGERPDRVRVAVETVPFSRDEVRAALAVLRGTTDLGVEPTASYPCADGSGLVVGVDPDELGDRRARLQDELAAAAGMPVLVIAQAEDAEPVG